MASHHAAGNALHANFDVDYVISYRFADTSMRLISHRLGNSTKVWVPGKDEAAAGFEKLVQALATVGLAIEVRNGDNCSVLVFVKVGSDKRLNNEIYRSR